MNRVHVLSILLLLLVVGQKYTASTRRLQDQGEETERNSGGVCLEGQASFRRARSAPDNKKEKDEEAKIQNEANPQPSGKNKIRCPDGKVKRFNVLPKCRMNGI